MERFFDVAAFLLCLRFAGDCGIDFFPEQTANIFIQ
jgi:hypothetical protein